MAVAGCHRSVLFTLVQLFAVHGDGGVLQQRGSGANVHGLAAGTGQAGNAHAPGGLVGEGAGLGNDDVGAGDWSLRVVEQAQAFVILRGVGVFHVQVSTVKVAGMWQG